jgi:hypothetical protein
MNQLSAKPLQHRVCAKLHHYIKIEHHSSTELTDYTTGAIHIHVKCKRNEADILLQNNITSCNNQEGGLRGDCFSWHSDEDISENEQQEIQTKIKIARSTLTHPKIISRRKILPSQNCRHPVWLSPHNGLSATRECHRALNLLNLYWWCNTERHTNSSIADDIAILSTDADPARALERLQHHLGLLQNWPKNGKSR